MKLTVWEPALAQSLADAARNLNPVESFGRKFLIHSFDMNTTGFNVPFWVFHLVEEFVAPAPKPPPAPDASPADEPQRRRGLPRRQIDIEPEEPGK